ncbi:MAG TPA: hypothetical protein VII78_16760 [Myxococcota bacterium]
MPAEPGMAQTIPAPEQRAGALMRGAAFALTALGFGVRLVDVLTGDERLFQHWPTEDGYLMLTVARNLALGLGMSTAEGTLPTNGVQPLATFLWAACFALVGGDKAAGVRLVLLLSTALAAVGGFAVFRLAQRILAGRPNAQAHALLAGALWFAAPQIVQASMNCLETGLMLAVTALTANAFAAWAAQPERDLGAARTLGLGLWCGLLFWCRVDSVFLIGAICALRVLSSARAGLAVLGRRIGEAAGIGFTALIVGAPWMLNNYWKFGSIVPISGSAEGSGVELAQNLPNVAAKLLELITITGLVPRALEDRPLVIAVCATAVLVWIALMARFVRGASAALRAVAALFAIQAALLVAYYGVVFGAGYFLARYFTPLSIPATILGVAWLGERATRSARWRSLAVAALLVACALALALHVRDYRGALPHQHRQVVTWVEGHVPDDVWVGAVQTGTLGFFHDRTINLDGKVNPEALAARLAGRTQEYVVASKIQYLADWAGIAAWADAPAMRGHFELIVHDEARNLAVLRRIGAPEKAGTASR